MTLPPMVRSLTTSVLTESAGASRAAATNRLVSSAKPARASAPLCPTQVWVVPMTAPSNAPARARRAGPASCSQRLAPMPARTGTPTQSRCTVPSTVGTTALE